MNIAQLKAELVKRGITPASKWKKSDLQKALKDAVKNSIFIVPPTINFTF